MVLNFKLIIHTQKQIIMTFIETGQYFDTMTTVDDPQLTVTETDNGHNWYIDFRVGNKIIDTINLEYINPNIKISDKVRKLPITTKGLNSTVGEVIDNAISLKRSHKNQSDIAMGIANANELLNNK